MTTEKAIDLLDNLLGMVSDNQESDYDEALKMGIQALRKDKNPGMLEKVWDGITISECKKEMPCIDCDNTACWFQGKKESDCPKYKCDNPTNDCENGCEFIDRFIEDLRKGKNDEAGV